MYNRNFFGTKLGQAALASVAAMTAMIAFTNQMSVSAKDASFAEPHGETTLLVELA